MLTEHANILDNQIYIGDDEIVYNILKLVEWAERNCQEEDIPVELLAHEFETGYQRSHEPDGSPEFISRALQAGDFPIIVQRTGDNILWVMDGRHRLWRAVHEGRTTIKGFVIPVEHLPEDAVECEGEQWLI